MEEFDRIMAEAMSSKQKKVSNPDILGREKVIGDISEIISHRLLTKESTSLAVMGQWGVGKSFVLNEIEKAFSGKCIIFHYDCWKNDYYEEPLVGILSVFTEQLNSIEADDPDNQQDHYYDLMRRAVREISLCISQRFTQIDIRNICELFTKISDKIKQKKAIELNPICSLSTISDVIEVINKLLSWHMVYEGKKILFVVDELDRCMPDYSLKILNRLHHICYETPLIQLVAINDRELIANINGLFARDDDGNENFAKSYLQRFFTDFYRIPVGNSHELLKHCWKDFSKFFYSRMEDDYFDLFLSALLNNTNFTIREKKKVLDLFRNYHMQILDSSKEKFPYELACAELLEVFRLFFGLESDWVWETERMRFPELDDDYLESETMTGNLSDSRAISPYYLTNDTQNPFFSEKIEPVQNFFLQECKKKYESIENGLLPKGFVSSSDFVIALFPKRMDLPGRETTSEMSTIVKELMNDDDFKKTFNFFQAFKEKICI